MAAPAIAAACLAPPVLAPAIAGQSVYDFGLLGLMGSAIVAGPVGATMTSGLALLVGLLQDGGLPEGPSGQVRTALFVAETLAAIGWISSFEAKSRGRSEAVATAARQAVLVQSIMDTSPDAMLMIDTSGTVKCFSASAERLFGWSADEVMERNVRMLMPERDAREHDGHLSRYRTTGRGRIIGRNRHVEGLRKDGTTFPMLLYIGEMTLDGERRFTGFVRDLTELEAANQRTQDVRSQLAHVWSMNSLGEMAAILAHELNQPLAAIANYTRAAKALVGGDHALPPDVADAIRLAGEQAMRASEIIRRMRGLIARKDVDLQPVSLRALINEIDFMNRLITRAEGVVLLYDLFDGEDLVAVDPIQIQQVVVNLVRNAVEAAGSQSQGVIEIKTRRTPDGWEIAVGDNGPGVPASAVPNIFHAMQSSKPNGMGLGLAISRGIVEHHRGAMRVGASRFGGAEFCICLPAADGRVALAS